MNHLMYRKATVRDLACLDVMFQEAIEFLKEQGIDQWQRKDATIFDFIGQRIDKGTALVWEWGGEIIAFASLEADNRDYELAPIWEKSTSYLAIHRVMVSASVRGQGLMASIFRDFEQIALSEGKDCLRIETHTDNKIMQHLFSKYGYDYCGLMTYPNGQKRPACEKKLLPFVHVL